MVIPCYWLRTNKLRPTTFFKVIYLEVFESNRQHSVAPNKITISHTLYKSLTLS